MLVRRTQSSPVGGLIAAVVVLLLAPATAHAATPPTLSSPEGGASVTEGAKVTFSWNGSLQGEAASLSRSFFRVEIAPASSVPADAQAAWTTLSNYQITTPGESINELDFGAPESGSYKWRVCAWGVADSSTSTSVEQLPGGCSSSRSLTTTAASEASQSIGSVTVQGETRTESEPDTVVTKTRPGKVITKPAANKTITLPRRQDQIVRVETELIDAPFGTKGTPSAVTLDEDGAYDLSGERSGVAAGAFGVITRGLSATLPVVPIPFWALLLMGAAIPLTGLWRRTTRRMFDWPEGSEDTLEDMPVGTLKSLSTDADGSQERAPTPPERLSA